MRKSMTENYVSNWFNSKSYLSCATIYDNLEERISYDIQQLIILSKNMFLTIIHSVSTLVSFSIHFVGVIWSIILVIIWLSFLGCDSFRNNKCLGCF